MKTLLTKQIIILLVSFVMYSIDCKGQNAWNWVKSYGGNDNQHAYDMVLDSQGNIYIAGSFWSSATFGEKHFTANPDYGYGGFVAKFDKAGILIWANQINLSIEDKYASAIVIDKDQNIYVTGSRLKKDNTKGYMYLNKYSNDGTELWSLNLGDYYWDDFKHKTLGIVSNVLCVAGKDSIYTINTSGSIISRKKESVNTISDNGNNYFLVAKDNKITILDTLLNTRNTLVFNSAHYKVNALTLKDNFIYTTGSYDPLQDGHVHMFVTKLDYSGNILWSKTEDGDEYGMSQGNSILVDNKNKICVAGFYIGVVKFDSITVGEFGLFSEIFVSKYSDSTGKLEDFIHAGGGDEDVAFSLAVDSANNLKVAGSIRQGSGTVSVNFGDIMLPGSSEYGDDVFIANVTESDFSASIKGQITLNNEAQNAYFKVYRKNEDTTYTNIYRGQTDESGNYTFTVHRKGIYLVKTDNHHQIRTYYKQAFLWNLADQITITNDTTINNINIDIIQCSPLNGEDSISGKIYSYDGTLKSFVDILLVNSTDQLVAFTQSDSLGYYYFANVPKGVYKILIESAGTYMDSCYTINNSLKSAMATSLDVRSFRNCDYIFENDNKIYKKTSALAVPGTKSEIFPDVYPNPANTFLIIKVLPEPKDLNLKIYDFTGNCVYKTNLNSSFKRIDITSFPTGKYFINFDNKKVEAPIIKFIKIK